MRVGSRASARCVACAVTARAEEALELAIVTPGGETLARARSADGAEYSVEELYTGDPQQALGAAHAAAFGAAPRLLVKLLDAAMRQNLLGNLALAKGETREALQHLETAVKLAPNSGKIRFALSRAYRRLGRREEAAKQLHYYEDLKVQEMKSGP